MSDRVIADTLDGAETGHHVFVPAVMSVGVLFSVATLVRDAITRSGRRSIHRRAVLDGRAVADGLLRGRSGGRTLADPALRRTAALVGAPLATAAVYLVPGSVANYLRTDGYVSNIAWLLALSLTVAAALAVAGGGLLAVAIQWPTPAVSTRGAVRLLVSLGVLGDGRRHPTGWDLTAVTASIVTAFLMLALTVSDELRRFDEELAEEVRDNWPDSLRVFGDLYGRTEVAVVLAILIGVSTMRCRPFAVTYVAAVGLAIGASNLIRLLVDRDRPALSDVAGGSFPSGHLLQAMLFVGLVPLALRVLGAGANAVRATGGVLVLATVLAGLQRIAGGNHWPTDILGGVATGLLVVACARIVLERSELHGRCSDCPWSPRSAS